MHWAYLWIDKLGTVLFPSILWIFRPRLDHGRIDCGRRCVCQSSASFSRRWITGLTNSEVLAFLGGRPLSIKADVVQTKLTGLCCGATKVGFCRCVFLIELPLRRSSVLGRCLETEVWGCHRSWLKFEVVKKRGKLNKEWSKMKVGDAMTNTWFVRFCCEQVDFVRFCCER